MVNLKLVAGGAVTGLIISLISGLIGGVSFGTVIIRALVSAVVCGGIAAAAGYVFARYLDVGDVAAETAEASRAAATGTTVNISVGDDPLPDSENAPDFIVTNSGDASPTTEMMRPAGPEKTDIPSATETVVPEHTVTSQFVPASLGSMTQPSPKNEHAVTSSPEPAQPSVSSEAVFEGLDVMPDIEDIVSSVDEPLNSRPPVEEESSFSEIREVGTSVPVSEADMGTDASLMAQAIRTLLQSEG